MANKKISELQSRTPALSDLMLVGDPSSGYSYKCTVTALATIIETDIADGYVTIGTTQTISGAKTFSNNLTLTSVANATTTQSKFLTLNGSNVVNYRTGAEVLADIGGASAALYVPYTGATTNVVLGMNNISANNLNVQPTGFGVLASLTRDISGSGYGILLLRNGANGYLQPSVMGVDRTWTLPNASGTIALTSDLSSYVPTSRTITINGTTFDLSANRTWNVGTVTSVGLSTGTTGTDVNVSGSPITSSGTITLNIPTASATNRGALSSTDWSTFNNKQNALTLTTTGTSGAATLVGSTLNIPQYQAALTNPVTGTGTTNYIPKFTSSSAIGNSVIYESGGSINIIADGSNATFTNGGQLAIKRLNNNPYLSFHDNAGARIGYLQMQATGATTFANEVAQPMLFATNGSERMRLDASGNLGLGTSSPARKLSVVGSAVFTDGTNDVTIWNDGSIGTNGNLSLKFNTNGSLKATLDASGNLGLGVTPSAWSLGKAIDINGGPGILGVNNGTQILNNAYYNGGWIYKATSYAQNLVLDNDGSFQFRIAPSGTAGTAISFTQAMTLDASGRLGLGVTNPSTRLHIVSGQNSIPDLYIQGAGSSQGWLGFGTTNDYGIQGGADYLAMNFRLNGAERMRITSGGLVAINTTSVNQQFTVAGSYTRMESRATDNSNAGTFFKVLNGASTVGQSSQLVDNAGNYIITTGTTSEAERMRITSGGNVGIATSSPASLLAVGGNPPSAGTISAVSASGGITLALSDNVNSSLYIRNTNGGAIIGTDGGGTIRFATSGNTNSEERMRLTSSGELLINTTSDAGDYKLQVNGNVYQTGNLLLTNGGDPIITLESTNTGTSQSPYIKFIRSTTGSARQWWIGTGIQGGTDNSFSFYDQTGSTERFRITTAGNGEFGGSIKTAAPSGGTAKPIKFGEIVTLGGSNTQGVRVEIDGTVYYLVTGYLP